MSQPTLYLFPNVLGPHKDHHEFLPASIDAAVSTIDGLIAESTKGSQRFLSRFKTKKITHHMPYVLYNKNTKPEDFDFILEPLLKGETWGLVSDAGVPCLADPGSSLVMYARKKGILVKAFVGPSSIVLAHMLSGLPGQRYFFHGYLPKDKARRETLVKELEKTAKKEKATQICIEAPHRSQAMLETLVQSLDKRTMLCTATNLTLSDELVVVQSIQEWRGSSLPDIHKRPTVFLIY